MLLFSSNSFSYYWGDYVRENKCRSNSNFSHWKNDMDYNFCYLICIDCLTDIISIITSIIRQPLPLLGQEKD